MKALSIIIAAVGGACPTLVTVANKLVLSKPGQHISDFIYPSLFLGMLLLAGLGTLVALVFQETDLKKAFVLGISAPALITSAVSSAQNSATGPGTQLPTPITTANGQETPKPPVSPAPTNPVPANPVFGRYADITLTTPVPLHVEFLDASGNPVLTAVLEHSAKLPIPGFAQKIRFSVQNEQSPTYALPTNEGEIKPFVVNVTGQRTFGINQAFGAPPDITYQMSVK
jgi:hypothetical protein